MLRNAQLERLTHVSSAFALPMLVNHIMPVPLPVEQPQGRNSGGPDLKT